MVATHLDSSAIGQARLRGAAVRRLPATRSTWPPRRSCGRDLAQLLAYDEPMLAVARQLGLDTTSPGEP